MVPSRVLPVVTPMQPTLVARPFHREGWVYEEKYDGWRVVAYKDGTAVRVVSRNGRDLTRRFPDLAGAVGALPARTLFLDGEVALFDAVLISRFEWLRGRPKDETTTPALYMAFDCLYARGEDLWKRSLRSRVGASEIHVFGAAVTSAAPLAHTRTYQVAFTEGF